MKSPEVKHLFIENPLTGRVVNVLPLFVLMQENDLTTDEGPRELVAQVDSIIRYVSTNIASDVDRDKLQLILNRLYIMHDAFEKMAEYKA